MILDEVRAGMQRLFDDTARHLLNQRACASIGGSCRYRGTDGMKCGIGACIPDEDYLPDMENKLASHHSIFTVLAQIYWPGLQTSQNSNGFVLRVDGSRRPIDLIEEIQLIHDVDRVEDWPERLKELAGDFQLDSSILSAA